MLTEVLLICCKILSVVEQLVLWEVLCVVIYVKVLHFLSFISVRPHFPRLYSMPYLNIYVCAKPFCHPEIPLFFFILQRTVPQ